MPAAAWDPFAVLLSTDWAIFKVCLRSKIQFMLVLLSALAKLSFETQVFLNIASHFQTAVWCCVRPKTVKVIFVLTGSMRREGAGGVKQCEGEIKWTLSAQRHLDLSSELQEPHCRPPRVLNYYHIYTCMQPAILFAYWPVECLKSTAAKYCFENSSSALENFQHISAPQ